MSVQVPTSIDGGLATGGMTTAAGTAALPATGAPNWMVIVLLSFTVLFVMLLLVRLTKRATVRTVRRFR